MSLDPSVLTIVLVAGASSLLSPCGFAMLPGYISYYMGAKSSFGKAVFGGIACTLGLLTVFFVIGVGISTLGSLTYRYIPFIGLIAGIIVILMGITMIIKIRFPTFFTRLRAPKQKGLVGIFFYGVVYGLANIGCSAPIFFAILFWAVVSGGLVNGVITFVIYAFGMGLPLILTTVLVAKAKELTLNKLVKMTPWIQRFSGIVLVIAGIYLLYFYYTVYFMS